MESAAWLGAQGRGDGNIPERSIKTACELCTVCHQCHLVTKSSIDETLLDGSNPTVHHVTGSDAVCTCLGVVDCDLSKTFDRRLVVDGSIGVKDTAVTVRCILAKTDVSGDVERGEGFAKHFDGLDYGSIGVVGERSLVVLLHANASRQGRSTSQVYNSSMSAVI